MNNLDLHIDEAIVLSDEAAALIDSTLWGTEDTLYTIPTFSENLGSIPDVRVLSLKKGSHLLGVRVGIQKTVISAGGSYAALYHTMFTVNPAERGKGYGKLLAQATVDRFTPGLKGRGILYAYTESANHRSLDIKKALGYESIGRFYTTAFSRLTPQRSPRVTKLSLNDLGILREHLLGRYQDHALCDLPHSLIADHYYVLSQGNDIVAGVQVKEQHWEIKKIAGVGGFLARHAIPHVPIIRDLFNPDNFRFLSFGNLYFKSGAGGAAHELMESVLAEYELKTGLIWIDHTSPVYQELAKAGPFGIMNSLAETAVDVTGLFVGFVDQEKEQFRNRPLFISPFDI